MNLDAEGKSRLEAMKKAVAVGLPLAGLLAGAAVQILPEPAEGAAWQVRGKMVAQEEPAPSHGVMSPDQEPPDLEDETMPSMGLFPPDEPCEPPEEKVEDEDEFVPMGELTAPEFPEKPENPSETLGE